MPRKRVSPALEHAWRLLALARELENEVDRFLKERRVSRAAVRKRGPK